VSPSGLVALCLSAALFLSGRCFYYGSYRMASPSSLRSSTLSTPDVDAGGGTEVPAVALRRMTEWETCYRTTYDEEEEEEEEERKTMTDHQALVTSSAWQADRLPQSCYGNYRGVLLIRPTDQLSWAEMGSGMAATTSTRTTTAISDPYMDFTLAGEKYLRPHYEFRFAIRSCRWHAPSKTLHADLVRPGNLPVDEILLSFSSNLHRIRASVIVGRPDDFASLEAVHECHPFDGTYRVVRLDLDAETESAPPATHVFMGDGVATMGRTPDETHAVVFNRAASTVSIGRPGDPESHREASFDFARHPAGPVNGDTVLFRLRGGVEEWTLVRKTTGPPPAEVSYMGPTGASVSYFRHWTAAERRPPIPIKYHGAALWGNSFVQYGSSAGQLAYSFATPSVGGSEKIAAYLSYGHPGDPDLAPLDDGSYPPERAHFRNATYDDSARTFVGSLKWLDDWGVTFQGMKRWDVKFRFDTEFTCILAGIVKAYPASGGEAMVLARVGKDHLFYNAALDQHFCSLLGAGAEALGRSGGRVYDATLLGAGWLLRQDAAAAASVVNCAQKPLLDRLAREGAKAGVVDGCRRLWLDFCRRVASIGSGS
jgi:hypothetical protein